MMTFKNMILNENFYQQKNMILLIWSSKYARQNNILFRNTKICNKTVKENAKKKILWRRERRIWGKISRKLEKVLYLKLCGGYLGVKFVLKCTESLCIRFFMHDANKKKEQEDKE